MTQACVADVVSSLIVHPFFLCVNYCEWRFLLFFCFLLLGGADEKRVEKKEDVDTGEPVDFVNSTASLFKVTSIGVAFRRGWMG